jgi:hypothetical protein
MKLLSLIELSLNATCTKDHIDTYFSDVYKVKCSLKMRRRFVTISFQLCFILRRWRGSSKPERFKIQCQLVCSERHLYLEPPQNCITDQHSVVTSHYGTSWIIRDLNPGRDKCHTSSPKVQTLCKAHTASYSLFTGLSLVRYRAGGA